MTASGHAFERKMVTTRYAVSIAQYHTMSSFDSNCPDFHQKQLWKLCYPIFLGVTDSSVTIFRYLLCKVTKNIYGCQDPISPSALIPCLLRSSNNALSEIFRSFAAPLHVPARL